MYTKSVRNCTKTKEEKVMQARISPKNSVMVDKLIKEGEYKNANSAINGMIHNYQQNVVMRVSSKAECLKVKKQNAKLQESINKLIVILEKK